MKHKPDPTNEKFCLHCKAAIEGEESGPCPVGDTAEGEGIEE